MYIYTYIYCDMYIYIHIDIYIYTAIARNSRLAPSCCNWEFHEAKP